MKEIQYSSRTRDSSDRIKQMQKIRSTLAKFMSGMAADLCDTEGGKILTEFADLKVYNIVQLIYRSKHYEGNTKDCEFSRLSMADHWRAGYDDAVRALEHKEIFERPGPQEGFRAFDFGESRGADASVSQRQEDRSSSLL
jgi:NTE family protein